MAERLTIEISGDARKLIAALSKSGVKIDQLAGKTKKAGKEVDLFGTAWKKARTKLIGIGLAALVADFGKEAFLANAEAKGLKNALEATLDPATSYAEAIAFAKTETRGMVDEATLASSVTAQLAGGLAKNAEEAAKLTQAGSILSTVFKASGASMGGFNKLLSTGSAALIDNFNLTMAQVNARMELITASTGLEDQEARLQAIKELLIESSEKYAGSISKEQEALAQSQAAWTDLKGALGEFIAGPGTDFLNWATESTRALQEGAEAWKGIGDQLDTIGEKRGLEAQRQQLDKLNSELNTLQGIVDDFGDESPADVLAGDLAVIAALEAQIAEIEAALEGARRATTRLDSAIVDSGLPEYQQAAFQAARAVDALAQSEREAALAIAQSRSAQAARMTGLAGQFGVETRQVDPITQRETLTAFFAPAEEVAEEAADAAVTAWQDKINEAARNIESVAGSIIGQGLGALGDLGLDFLGDDGGRAIAEDARRLAAIAAGDFSGEAARLLEQSRPELFAKVMAAEDPAAVAQDMLRDFQLGIGAGALIDKEAAKARIKRILLGQEDTKALVAEITNDLMGEGFSGASISQALGAAGFGGEGEDAPQFPGMGDAGGNAISGMFEGMVVAAEEGASVLWDNISRALTAAAVPELFMPLGDPLWRGVNFAMANSDSPAKKEFIQTIISGLVGMGFVGDPTARGRA